MARWTLLLLALLIATPGASLAKTYRVQPSKCVSPGETITVTGDFTRGAPGDFALVRSGKKTPLPVQSRSRKRVVLRVPESGVAPGRRYQLQWLDFAVVQATLGRVKTCKESGGGRTARPSRPARPDEAPAPDGGPEYVVSAPSAQAGVVSALLQQQGAVQIRTRALPALGRTLLFFSLPATLTPTAAQILLDTAAPGSRIDVHHIYSYAATPRLYAASLIGDGGDGRCSLPRAVAVGLIDGPVNTGHPALKGVSVTRKSVLTDAEHAPSTDHGTAVAALIGGAAAAGPLAGFAPGAKLFAASAFSVAKGRIGARLENIAAGLDWLVSRRVRIANMSFAGAANQALGDVISAASTKGLVMVAAAGNDGANSLVFPAGAPEVIAVTAVDANGRLYRKANTGAYIEFAAPGVEVFTAKGKAGGYQTGTSFAAPIVTALAARRLATAGSISLDALRSRLRGAARDLGPPGRDTTFGWGLVQADGC